MFKIVKLIRCLLSSKVDKVSFKFDFSYLEFKFFFIKLFDEFY